MGLSRSAQMARIKSRDTKPERLVRSELWRRSLRYRLRYPVPAGRPDLVFPGHRMVVFIDGCFWHGCPEHYVPPRSKRGYWEAKLEGNVRRDIQQTQQLEAAGWRVIRAWECEVEESPAQVADRIEAQIKRSGTMPTVEWRVLRVSGIDRQGSKECRILVDLRNSERCRVAVRARSFASLRRGRPREADPGFQTGG